jgi:N-acetylneuraminate synthase
VYQNASLPLEWTGELKSCCDQAGIDYFTAPYDLDLVPSLTPHVCAWKLGSGDITWHEMIRRLAMGGKPLLIATGAATLQEVRDAVAAARGCRDIVLMQCNTNYTGSLENLRYVNLRVLETYAKEFPGLLLGLSDHTPGHSTVLGGVALGARVVEKHFTDDKGRQGPDHGFSMSPAEWQEMVTRTRELEAALGDGVKRVMDNESETVVLQRRAIRAGRALRAGESITEDAIVLLRPCPEDAVPPYRMADVLGRTLTRDIDPGEHIRPADLL